MPTFMIMTFYFYYNTLKAKKITKKQRIERIVIPHIIWPIFIFIVDHILFKFC